TAGYMNQHNPFVWFSSFGSRCGSHVALLGSNFATDLNSATPPSFAFVVPNRCGDMHENCLPTSNAVLQGDQWLRANLPTVLNSSWYANGGVVIITCDEGSGGGGWNGTSGGQVPTLVIAAGAHGA